METEYSERMKEIRRCLLSPGYYRICHSNLCLPREELCPCSEDELRCGTNGTCIPHRLWCDGRRHCSNGEDEAQCQYPQKVEDTSLPVILGLLCGVLLVVFIVALLLFFKLWNRHQFRKKSNSGNDPLDPDSENFLAHACHSQPNSSSDSENPDSRKSLLNIKTDNDWRKGNFIQEDKTLKHNKKPYINLMEQNNQKIAIFKPEVETDQKVFTSNLQNILSTDFGQELLCTSTPRQKAKQYPRPISTCDIPQIQIGGDLGTRLNLSMFETIT